MIKKKLIFIIILIALLPLVFITGQSSWLILDEVESDIENKYYPVSVDNEIEVTYDGKYKSVSANDESSADEQFDQNKVKVEYFNSKDGRKDSKRSTNPINAGMYYADTYYDNTLIGTTLLTIKPYPIYIIPNSVAIEYGDDLTSLNPGYKTYELLGDGSYKEKRLFTNEEAGRADTLSFEYNYNYTYKQYDKTGVYEVGIDITPNTNTNLNYSLSTPKKSTLTVNKKHLSFTWDTLEFVYDGKIHNPSITINNNLSSHGLTPSFTGSVSKDVGTYPITLQKEYDNFILDGEDALFSKNVVITKRSIFTNGLKWTSGDFSYNGEAQHPIAITDNKVGNDDVSCVYEFYSGEAKLASAPVNAGTYRVKLVGLSGNDSKNYSFEVGEVTYTIKKANPQKPSVQPLNAKVGDLISSLTLPEGFRLDGYSSSQKFTTGGLVKLNVIYNPDSNNYNDLSTTLDVIVQEDDKIAVSIKFENTTVTYDGKVHHPSYQIYLDGVAGAMPDGAILTINYEKSVLSPTNAGTYRIVNVGIGQLPPGYSYMQNDPNNDYKNHTIAINPLEVNMCSSLEMDYDGTARKFADFSNKLKAKLTFNNINGSQASVDLNAITINGMHNGVYAYGNVDRAGLDTSMSNVVGSTYLVTVSLNSNYKLNNNTLILKYKTAKCGNTLYTIEDAILNGSGEINFVGDASSTTSYVATSFTRLTFEEGNPYNDGKKIRSYFEVKRNLVVPYGPECNGSGNNNRIHDPAGTIDAVYSALIIPTGVKVEFTSGAVLSIGAVVKSSTIVSQRGVLINEGTIDMNSGTKIDCYGYLKGKNGIINLKSGATAVDCMRMYDWPGGSNASKIYKNVFPISRWSLHNISCRTKVYSGSEYLACAFIVAGGFEFEKFITVLGKSSDKNFLFKPTDGNGFIEKYTKPADSWAVNSSDYNTVYSITGSNQKEGQQDIIELNGNYVDGNLSLSINAIIIRVEIGTSLDKSMPLSYVSVVAKSGTNLSLNKSDYLFLPGTSLTVEKGAKINIGAGVDLVFATIDSITRADNTTSSFINNCVDKVDAKCIMNGELVCNGNIGGEILSTEADALLNIAGAKTTANFQILNGVSGTIWFNSSVVAKGKLDSSEALSNLASNVYISTESGKTSYWVSTDNVSEFTLEFYDDDGITLLTTKKIMVFNTDKYVVTGDEFVPSRLHYIFKNWVAMDGSPIEGQEFVVGNVIKMKAAWEIIHYSFSYSAGHGIDKNNDIIYVDAQYQNQNPSFTINDFKDGRIDITTTATYDQDKYFDGWYFGIDKTIGIKTTFITRNLLDKMAEAVPGLTDIPLFCNFTDSITISFWANYPNNNHPELQKSLKDIEVSGLELIDLPSLNQFDNIVTEAYYFGGWYYDIQCAGPQFDPNVPPTENITLYAKWIPKKVINIHTGTKLNKDLGVNEGVKIVATYYYKPEDNITITLPENLTEQGHTFVGWSYTNVTNGKTDFGKDTLQITSNTLGTHTD